MSEEDAERLFPLRASAVKWRSNAGAWNEPSPPLLPIYPVLFAGGAVFWEQLLYGKRRALWLKLAYPLLLLITGALFAPMAAPVPPVETFLRYQKGIGFEPPKTEVGHVGPPPPRDPHIIRLLNNSPKPDYRSLANYSEWSFCSTMR